MCFCLLVCFERNAHTGNSDHLVGEFSAKTFCILTKCITLAWTLYTLPCCRASSWLPSPGTWVSGLRGKWNTSRRGVASRGSCEGSAWFSAPLAGSFQTAYRCSPPPAGSCKTDKHGWHHFRKKKIIIIIKNYKSKECLTLATIWAKSLH